MAIFYDTPPQGPCVVRVQGPGYEPARYYGPFPSIRESQTWMNIQFEQGFRGSFSVCPIYTPYRIRSNDDWYMSDRYRNSEDISADMPSKPWFKLKSWKKWLRKVSPLAYAAYKNKLTDFDDLPDNIRINYIAEAFQSLVDDDQVPYGIITGDDDTWDNYDPAIDLARKNYEENYSLS